MATDNQVVASLDTETGALGSGAADGPYTLQGYDPNMDKWFFSDEEGYLYSVDPDGTNVEEVGRGASMLSNGPTGGGPENPIGHIVDGWLYAVGNEGGVKRMSVSDGVVQDLGDAFAQDGVQTYFAPNQGTIGLIYWSTDGNDLRTFDIDDESEVIIVGNAGSGDFNVLTIAPEKENSDATVGVVWWVESPNTRIEMHASDSTTAVPNILNDIDLTNGFPDSFSAVIDIEYDANNDILYLLIETGSTPARQIWTLPATESAVASEATLVGDVSDDANTPASRIVPVFDSYDTISGTDIASLEPVLWLDAANALDSGGGTPSDNAAVDSWPNDGSGSDPTSINGAIYKTSITNLNNLPAVRLDGVDDYVKLADGTLGWPLSIYIVYEASVGNGYILWTGSHGTSAQNIGIRDNAENINVCSDADNDCDDTFLNASHNSGQILGVRDISFSASSEFGVNVRASDPSNDLIFTTAGFTTPTDAGMNSDQILGLRPDSSLPSTSLEWGGDIAEVVAFNKQLLNAEQKIVIDELKAKYNLA